MLKLLRKKALLKPKAQIVHGYLVDCVQIVPNLTVTDCGAARLLAPIDIQ